MSSYLIIYSKSQNNAKHSENCSFSIFLPITFLVVISIKIQKTNFKLHIYLKNKVYSIQKQQYLLTMLKIITIRPSQVPLLIMIFKVALCLSVGKRSLSNKVTKSA